MTRPARPLHAPLILPVVAACLVVSCSGPTSPLRLPNQPPSVRFTLAPVSADPNDPVFYAYRVYWAGDDPDGRIDHYDYAIDPGPRDTAWVSTTHNEEVLFFRSTTADAKGGPLPLAQDYHVLVIRAVDNQGAMSPRKFRAFYSYTVAPTVEIVAPHPNKFIEVKVPPTLSIQWQGTDPDGQRTTRPVLYRYRLLRFNPASDNWMLTRPDSLYGRELAAGFAGRDTTGGDTTSARFTNLVPGDHYLFLLLAVDEAGALSPVLSVDENLLQVAVDLAATLGPRIHVFNSYLDYTYDSGGYTVDELRWIKLQAPADRPINFNWEAFASAGANIARYRWGVDLASVADETPRGDEVHDYFHWSRGGPLEQSCTLVGLPPGQHFLYIDAKDNNGFASLGIVAFKLVTASFNQDLLVVDDTRRELDRLSNAGGLQTYTDFWPSATELDTFLFARGGVPWRATQFPASGVMSPPGVFAGYAFDTLGTRQGLEIPSNGVTLETLGRYRHVVWILDSKGASTPGTDAFPLTVLRYMCDKGRANSLAAYVQAGGRVWLMGGGAGTASIAAFDDARNNTVNGPVFDNALNELVPGRLMYDGPHWQSAFASQVVQITVSRSPRADSIAASPWSHDDRWTGGVVSAPDYRHLPPEMRLLDRSIDPMPPTRMPGQTGLYYRDVLSCEYLMVPNVVTEDVDLSQTGVRIGSTLDTLYDASSLLLIHSPAPIMTYYHGAEANRFVFTGFAPWSFHRADCIALTDFVLHDIWGLTRAAADRSLAGGGAGARPATIQVRTRGTAGRGGGYE